MEKTSNVLKLSSLSKTVLRVWACGIEKGGQACEKGQGHWLVGNGAVNLHGARMGEVPTLHQ